jgi:4-amino-4-deoxy-L-arabinose transferase-like glycosyltransferase
VSNGRVFFYPENLYAGFPQLVGMLFTWAVTLHSITSASTLGWAVAVVMFVGVEGFARRILGERVAWLAPAILLSGFSISQAMHWAYVDVWVMLYGLLMLICLDQYREMDRRVWLGLAGVMVGFAIGAKYTAGVTFFAGALVLLPFWGKSGMDLDPSPGLSFRFRRLFSDWLIFGVITALVVSPWLVKNLILAGNPFYPIMFSGSEWDPWRQTFQGGSKSMRSLLNDLLLPLDVTLYGIEGAIVEGKLEYGASVGPLMLALIPGLILGWKRFRKQQKGSLFRLIVAALGAWLIWSIGAHFADELMRPRHYYGIFPALALLAVAGFEAASSVNLPQIRVRRVLGVLVALALGLAAYAELVFFVSASPLPVLVGLQAEMDYVTQELGGYGQAIQAVNDLPSGSVVFFLWEPRTLYCRGVTCYPDGTLDNWWYLQRAYDDIIGIRNAICQKGVTHLLVNDMGVDVYRDMPSNYEREDWTALARFRESALGKAAKIGDGYSLHGLDCSISIP